MYVIKRIKDKRFGNFTERHYRRKGHRVFIAHVELGEPLEATYIDDGDKTLLTSPVEAFNPDWNDSGSLIVQTENSVYVFKKEAE